MGVDGIGMLPANVARPACKMQVNLAFLDQLPEYRVFHLGEVGLECVLVRGNVEPDFEGHFVS